MPQTSHLILLLLSRITTSHAHLLVPRHANTSGSVHATTTFPLPVVVTADPSISTDALSASTSSIAGTHGETQATSDPDPTTTERSSASSIHFSYVPGSESNAPSITGSTSSMAISSNEPTITSSALASAGSGASSIASVSLTYDPANSSQSAVRTSSTSRSSSTNSVAPIPRSTTFLTLYTTIYRSAKSGEAATAGDQPSESTATNGVASDIGKDTTTTTTIFTTIYAPATGGQSSLPGSASTSAAPSLGTESSLAPVESQPPATSHAPSASPTSTSTASEKSGSGSMEIPSSIVFSYVPGSTFITSTKSHTNSPSTGDISTIQFSYVPGSASSSAPSDTKLPESPPPYMGTIAASSTAEPSPSTTPSKPGGITIIPVDPNATTITITKTDPGVTQTVTETVAKVTVAVTACTMVLEHRGSIERL